MIEPTQRHAWFWRRVLTYAACTVLAVIGGVAVWRAPDPQYVGIAAIVALWLTQTVYVTSATFADFIKLTRAATEGIQAAKEDA
jgi:hypothetical protein